MQQQTYIKYNTMIDNKGYVEYVITLSAQVYVYCPCPFGAPVARLCSICAAPLDILLSSRMASAGVWINWAG